MHSLYFLTLIWFLSLALFFDVALSRHLHGRRMHRHHARQIETPIIKTAASSSSITASLPSVTEGEAVIKDIHEIQKGLTDLPSDILKFILAVERRLQGVESMIASLLSGSAVTTISPTIATSSQASPTHHLTIPAPTPAAEPTTSYSSMCRPPAGAGPLVPCPASRQTYTRTSTSLHVVTTNITYTLRNQTVLPHGSGTAPTQFIPGVYPGQTASGQAFPFTVPYNPGRPFYPVTGNATTSSLVSYSSQPSSSPYTFQPDADSNVAVYYGTSPDTQQGGLLALCESPDVDIAILSFVFDFFGPQGYPSLDFGPGCSSPNAAQSEQASGLMDCTELASEIASCQQIGKKVLVSLGGYLANTSFVSDDQATSFAETLWNLFGAGTGDNPDIRPFGTDVVVDGFDIDNENHNTAYYETFATALRQQFSTDASKTYYLSAAPQCPMPDESIPVGAMTQADFVWVQFYNNPACNLNSDGFQSSFAAWSANLSNSSTTPGKPRVYVGVAAFEGAGSGYVQGAGLSTLISLARELYVDNLGGIMMWDGSEAMANVDQYGVNYLDYAKAALQG